MLAGVQSLQLMDDAIVTMEDLAAQFFLGVADVGVKSVGDIVGEKSSHCDAQTPAQRAEASLAPLQALNPMVQVSRQPGGLDRLTAELVTQFDVVVVTAADLETMVEEGGG